MMKMFDIIKYYSVNNLTFEKKFKYSAKAIKKANDFDKDNYKRKTKILYNCTDSDVKFLINVNIMSCNCKYYFKWGLCAHLLAFEKIFLNKCFYKAKPAKFVFKSKKGPKGRYGKASKALNK